MPYVCIFPECSVPHRLYESRREWFLHLQIEHFIAINSEIKTNCELCFSSIPSGKQFERHFGRHLEELALFALPRFDDADGEEEIFLSDTSDVAGNCSDLDTGDLHSSERTTSKLDLRSTELGLEVRPESTPAVPHDREVVDKNNTSRPPNSRPRPGRGKAVKGMYVFEASEVEETMQGPSNDSYGSLQPTSYWSVSEQRDFPRLLAHFGLDFEGISNFMRTKTTVMVSLLLILSNNT